VRVIAGHAKGRRLKSPPGQGTRPMMDRVKEALFSSLGSRVPGSDVLDLYAGSGALGIEALSRGAASAVFVEQGWKALQALRSNLEAVGLGGEIVGGTAEEFLATSGGSFDLMFIDPPYRLSLALLGDVLAAAGDRLGNGGVMVVHRRAGEAAPPAPPGLSRIDERRYGDTQLWIYQRDGS